MSDTGLFLSEGWYGGGYHSLWPLRFQHLLINSLQRPLSSVLRHVESTLTWSGVWQLGDFLFQSLTLGSETSPVICHVHKGYQTVLKAQSISLWKFCKVFSLTIALKWLVLEEIASDIKLFHSTASGLKKMCVIPGSRTKAGYKGRLLRGNSIQSSLSGDQIPCDCEGRRNLGWAWSRGKKVGSGARQIWIGIQFLCWWVAWLWESHLTSLSLDVPHLKIKLRMPIVQGC